MPNHYKTPNFDKALDETLNELQPYQRTCRQCQGVFEVFSEDIEFYHKLRVPAPTLCPSCRLQRRLGWRINFLPIFYRKTCSAPGHNEKLISFYSEENPVKVYDDEYYLSDKWDALEFGRDYDFNKPFFEQFEQLTLTAPYQCLQKDPKCIDCDYVVSGVSARNCYYVALPYYSENIYYSHLPVHSRDCIDVKDADYCEQCYKSVCLNRSYNCNFCYECSNCLDCYFLYGCRNCQNCFGGTNLRNKQYYFFNEPLTKEEYQKKIKEINLGKRSVLGEYAKEFKELFQKAIRRGLNNISAENSFGNDIRECRNCFYAFRALNCENLRYVASADKYKDAMDLFGGTTGSLVYESTGASFGSKMKFSIYSRYCLELEYSMECRNCEYCFGCFGLRNKKYCIFNKQYTEDEYWRLVDKIKTEMLKKGDYGEFFPLKYSPFPYQDSNASIEFPISKEEIIKQGWHWQEEIKRDIDLSEFNVLQAQQVPDDISDVSDEILKAAIICEQTQKPFRITKFELDFYRKKNIPIPTIHPLQRIKDLFAFRHPFHLWQYPCSKCGQMMYSGYDPAQNLKVYCEACYLKEVV